MKRFTPRPNRTFALIVGIEQYEESNWNIKNGGAVNDAIKFAEWLLNLGLPEKNIWLCLSPLEKKELTNLSIHNIHNANRETIFDIITNNISVNTGDLLYIFWAGHGLINQKRIRKLICADATRNNWKNIDLDSLIVYTQSDLFNIRRHIYIIDACANYISEYKGGGDQAFLKGNPINTQQFVFLATREGETAKINQSGYFSKTVIKALQQQSLSPNMEELVVEVKNQFKSLSIRQLPTIIQYQNWDGDFKSDSISPSTSLVLRIFFPLFYCSIVAILVTLIRYLGVIEKFELSFYDFIVRQQVLFNTNSIKKSKNIIVIAKNEEEIEKTPPTQRGSGTQSFSENELFEVLNVVKKLQPSVIGLTIYREGKLSNKQLENILTEEKNIVFPCHPNRKRESYEVILREKLYNQIGFLEVIKDEDNVVRRQRLLLEKVKPDQVNHCGEPSDDGYYESFALKVALKYLEKQKGIVRKIKEEVDEKDKDRVFIKIGDVEFDTWKLHKGGYHKPNSSDDYFTGLQVLLNYRPYKRYEKDIAVFYSFEESKKLTINQVKGKIILIGAIQDRYFEFTPYSKKKANKRIPLTLIHAQKINHILDAVIDNGQKRKPLLKALSPLNDFSYILTFSILGYLGIIILTFSRNNQLLYLFFYEFCIVIILFIYCYIWMISFGVWVPIFPSLVAIFMNTIIIISLHLNLNNS